MRYTSSSLILERTRVHCQCVRRYRHALIVLHSLQQQTDDNADLLRLRQCQYTAGGLAGPSAAGQICRPFVLGFGNWRACLKYKSVL